MYDSVTVDCLPADATMIASYRDGRYANEAEVRRRFPDALVVTITVRGQSDADVIDCEQGDATPEEAAAWARRQLAKGKTPTIYCSVSSWGQVRQAVAAAGITGQVCYWIAHYDNDPTLPAGAVAKQYRNDVAANLDTSSVASYWPGVDPPPVLSIPANPQGDPNMIVVYAQGRATALLTQGRLYPLKDNAETDALRAAGVPVRPIAADQFDELDAISKRLFG